jgi:hypothetical protein
MPFRIRIDLFERAASSGGMPVPRAGFVVAVVGTGFAGWTSGARRSYAVGAIIFTACSARQISAHRPT